MLYTQHLDSKPSNKTDKVKVNIFVFKVTLTIVFRNTYEIILCWTKYPYDDIFKGKDQNANDCDCYILNIWIANHQPKLIR